MERQSFQKDSFILLKGIVYKVVSEIYKKEIDGGEMRAVDIQNSKGEITTINPYSQLDEVILIPKTARDAAYTINHLLNLTENFDYYVYQNTKGKIK